MITTVRSEVLVIGGGMAAVMAAMEAAGKRASTVIVDRGAFLTSGSSPVGLRGFGTTTSPDDNPDLLFKDLLRVGQGINEQNLILEAAQGAVENQRLIESIGMRFVRMPDGNLNYYKGVGHSVKRGLDVDREFMGVSCLTVVAREAWRRGVRLYDDVRVTKILGNKDGVVGALGVSSDGNFYVFDSKSVILAAGGANNLYPNACSKISDQKYWTLGDAFTLAFNLGVPLIDMEFPNFREGQAAGISRGGGFLVNATGERIMPKYDPIFLELAPRGKLVEAMFNEVHEGRGPIYWQLPEKIPEFIMAHYGWKGMEGKKVQIEIDYQRLLGGAKINERAETSVKGLFAAGESTGGFHGADRMQNASFLECTIFGARAGRNAAEYASNADVEMDMSEVNEEIDRLREIQSSKVKSDPYEMFEAVQNAMWKYCSVVKQADEMEKCLELIMELRKKKLDGKNIFAALDAINLTLTAEMVVRASLKREETRGMHMRRDYPVRDDTNWMKHVVIVNRNGKVTTTTIPITEIRSNINA